MCLYSTLIKNRKYTSNKKNQGNIPLVTDPRVLYVPKACGNCIECRKQKTREWQVRLQEDIMAYKNAKFITLTFNNEGLQQIETKIKESINDKTKIPTGYNLDNAVATYAIRHFLERWRKKYKTSLRHWLVTELGTGRYEHLHIHGIVWTDNLNEVERIWNTAEDGPWGWVWKGKKIDSKYQKDGYEIINYVNQRTVNYITKYITKIDTKHPNYKPIILTSPGIGHRYTQEKLGNWNKNKFKEDKTNEAYTTPVGTKLSLPIYYRNKIYTEQEREKLWLNKLNKMERWVLGQKISIRNGEEEYNTAIREARLLNIELGYRTSHNDQEQLQYETDRRTLIQETRKRENNKKKKIQNAYAADGSAGIGY